MPILPIVKEFLWKYVDLCPYIIEKDQNSDEFLFWGEKGGRLSRTFSVKLLRNLEYLVNSGSHITPHSLRHSFATHLIRNNANIRAVEEMLGHASLATTEKYTKLQTEDLLSAYKEFHPLSKKDRG